MIECMAVALVAGACLFFASVSFSIVVDAVKELVKLFKEK